MIFFIVEIVIFALLLTADLVSKHYISAFLAEKATRSHPLIKGVIELRYTENTGASFGLFSNGTVALIVLTAIAMAALLVYLVVARKEKKYIRLPLVVILAGGIGNLVDRIKFGYVRDFFNFQFIDFAIFNVADTCITVGAVLLILSLAVAVVKDAQKKKAAASANNSAEDGMGSDAEACFGDNGTPIEDESEESESAASDGESG